MQRMLCSVLSLAIITPSLSGCSSVPVRPAITGPEVYGYTLYQPMTSDQSDTLVRTTHSFDDSLQLYLKAVPDGGVLGLYIDSDWWVDTVSKTSKPYPSEAQCQVAQQVGEAELNAVLADFNTRQPGDYRAVHALDACKRFTAPGVDGEAYRYTLWATLQAGPQQPGQAYPRKVEVTHSIAWTLAVLAIAIPVVVAVVVLTKGQVLSDCTYFPGDERRNKECDRKTKERHRVEREKDLENERLEQRYH
ncbi:hypothetical protein FX985_03607 [Pseudomonas extremaustralis]|uniref:Lipoprotein n=2 Tax=Pseudomonas extremaustralis TaxID=359110 RepID=A0A5M9J4P6_9PSED|nr:hypothetical protein FX985_03607 [Pseudomonas extremaustralis]